MAQVTRSAQTTFANKSIRGSGSAASDGVDAHTIKTSKEKLQLFGCVGVTNRS